jgi:hypothetical protein
MKVKQILKIRDGLGLGKIKYKIDNMEKKKKEIKKILNKIKKSE